MFYSSILSLIDSEIERLTVVRNLLSDAATPIRLPKKKPTARGTAEEAVAAAPVAFEPVVALEPVVAEETAVVAPKLRRLRSVRTHGGGRKRRALPVEPRALSSTIPSGAVAVSAAVVAERRETSVREATARTEPREVAVVEGTLDALLRELKVREAAA